MQYFSGRFKEKASDLIIDFHSSINFDKRLCQYDIMGSIAHIKGLEKAKIISLEDCILIEKNLKCILKDVNDGKINFTQDFEDIHMNIEKILIDRIGDIGKKIHTGRSRNDQVALDMKLFAKDEVISVQRIILNLIKCIKEIGENHIYSYMPGFTHLQKAQPTSFSHYILAYGEMFKRDFLRLKNANEMLDYSPLGAAAFAGTTYPLDREYTSKILGFKGPTWNSMDSVSDRDYLIEIINAFSLIMVHLSRFCEEIIIFSSNDFGYIELSDSFTTGSSIMPQKKNPDAAELIRGKSGRVFGSLISILTTMKGLPLAYNKDMQEDKECFFDALDTVKSCLIVFIEMIKSMKVNKERCLEGALKGFINATDVADYLTEKGMSFRDAYKIVGNMVIYSIENNMTFEKFELSDFQKFSDLFKNDIYEKITIVNCVERRQTLGGPSSSSIKAHLKNISEFIEINEKDLEDFKLNCILD